MRQIQFVEYIFDEEQKEELHSSCFARDKSHYNEILVVAVTSKSEKLIYGSLYQGISAVIISLLVLRNLTTTG